MSKATGMPWWCTHYEASMRKGTTSNFTSCATPKIQFQRVFFPFLPVTNSKTRANNWYFVIKLLVKSTINHHVQLVQRSSIPAEYGDFSYDNRYRR